jgi:hypothetical protein
MFEENSLLAETMREGACIQKFFDYLRQIFDDLNEWTPADDEESRMKIKQVELMMGMIEEYSIIFDHVIAK